MESGSEKDQKGIYFRLNLFNGNHQGFHESLSSSFKSFQLLNNYEKSQTNFTFYFHLIYREYRVMWR